MPPLKQDIISRVTGAAMHIMHASHLYGTSLWPKNGLKAPTMANFDMKDIIEVRAFVHYKEDGTPSYGMLLNMFNINWNRVKKQQTAIEPILDQSIYDNVYFSFDRASTLGMGLTRTMGQMHFKFTIND
ncbi:hypothetical protein [Pedobacter nyackensis]|uniref:Uncharacterized protein n=1 Tax=Pedobacter nyackensis TaxID=475255 RepID=A0A1W1ZV74_9SPHI|nr:hypothetical protein [Pedobacter nyackensis]SMC52349.1 hypothetical protein SAMN04488101_10178 [Pedobacter nyackensis]